MTAPDWPLMRQLTDEVLESLAGSGPLRRSRSCQVDVTEQWTVFRVDGETVIFPPEGWQRLKCSCPANGWCRHRLAVLLLLRDTATNEVSLSPNAIGILDELRSETVQSELSRRAPGAHQRAARALRRFPRASWQADHDRCVVDFGSGDLGVTFLRGGGSRGHITGTSDISADVLLLAALKLVTRDTSVKQPERVPSESPVISAPAQGRLIAQVTHMAARIVERGIQNVLDSDAEGIRTLAREARALHARHLSHWLYRTAQVLDFLARDNDVTRGEELGQCVAGLHLSLLALQSGGHRKQDNALERATDFVDSVVDTILVPVGSRAWRDVSGAIGLTVVFWDTAHSVTRTTTVARRHEYDPGFSSSMLFSQPVWPGVGSFMSMVRAKGVLARMLRLNEKGDFQSGHGDVRLCEAAEHVSGEIAAITSWAALSQLIRERYISTDTSGCYAILRPARTHGLQFDAVRQEYGLILEDLSGKHLQLCWPVSRHYELMKLRIEEFLQVGPNGHVVVYVQWSPALSVSPVGLFSADASGFHICEPDVFGPGAPPADDAASVFHSQLSQAPRKKSGSESAVDIAILQPIQRRMMRIVYHGVERSDMEQWHALVEYEIACRDAGLQVVANEIRVLRHLLTGHSTLHPGLNLTDVFLRLNSVLFMTNQVMQLELLGEIPQ